MGILVADRRFLGEIGLLDVGMKVYGGENVELGIRVSHEQDASGGRRVKGLSRWRPRRVKSCLFVGALL